MKDINKNDKSDMSYEENKDNIKGESSVNFIMCNEYGIDIEKSKIPLLESPVGDESKIVDNKENRLDEICVWNDEDYDDRHTTTLLVLGMIIAIIISYCAILTIKINKLEDMLMINKSVVSTTRDSVQDVFSGDIGIDILEDILVSKVVENGYSEELISAIYHVNNLSRNSMNPYDDFMSLAKAIKNSNISLVDAEYEMFAHVINNRLYVFVNNGKISEKEAEKVGVIFQKILSNSLDRF